MAKIRKIQEGMTGAEVADLLDGNFRGLDSDILGYAENIATINTTLDNHEISIANNAKAITEIEKTLADWFTLEDSVLHSKYGLASDKTVSSLGVGSSEGGSVSYNRLDSWDSYTTDKAGYVLSAALGWDLKTRLDNLDLGDFDLSGYLTKSEAQNTYATIGSLAGFQPLITTDSKLSLNTLTLKRIEVDSPLGNSAVCIYGDENDNVHLEISENLIFDNWLLGTSYASIRLFGNDECKGTPRVQLDSDGIILRDSADVPFFKAVNGAVSIGGKNIGSLAFKDGLTSSDIPSLSWNKITSDKPTTLGGYGITNAYTMTEADNRYLKLSGGTIDGSLSVGGPLEGSVAVFSADLTAEWLVANEDLTIGSNTLDGKFVQIDTQSVKMYPLGFDGKENFSLTYELMPQANIYKYKLSNGVITLAFEDTYIGVDGLLQAEYLESEGISIWSDDFEHEISYIGNSGTSWIGTDLWVKGNLAVEDAISIGDGDAKIWWDATNKVLRTNVSFASDKTVSSLGVGSESGGGGTGGYASLDNVASDVLPSASNTFTIGNSSRLWKAVYANSLYLGTTNVGDSISSLQSGLSTANGNIGTLNTRVTNIEGGYAKKATTLAGYGITDALPLSGGTIDGNIEINGKESNKIRTVYNDNKAITNISVDQLYAIRHALSFKWYETDWQIGNIRDNNTDSLGFGITKNNSHCVFRVNENGAWVNEKAIIHSGNIGSQSVNYATSAGSADKLSTARTIWGQSFDGSGDVSGNIYLDNNIIYGSNLKNALDLTGGGLSIGYGYRNDTTIHYWGKSHNFVIGEKNVSIINSSGNVTIGSSDLAGKSNKLYVEGNSYVNGSLTVSEDTSLSSSLTVSGTSSFNGDLTVNANQYKQAVSGCVGIAMYAGLSSTVARIDVVGTDGNWAANAIELGVTGDVKMYHNASILGDTSLSKSLTVQGIAELQSGLDVIGLIQGLDSIGGDTTWKITSDGAATVKNITVGSSERIQSSGNNFYIGNANNAGWVGMQDICSQDALGDSKWSIRTDGRASFGSTLKVTGATTLSSTLGVTGDATFNSKIYIGGSSAYIYWDATNKVLRTNVSFASDKTVSSLGVGSESGGNGGSADWGSVPTDIVPLYHDTYNLGSDDSWWSELYVNNIQSSVIFMGGGKVATESWVSNRGYMTNSAVKSYVSQEINTFREEHLGTAASYGVTTSVTSGSSSLVTSGGVYAYALAKAGGTITGTFTVHPSLGNTDDGYITVDKYGTLNGYGFGSQNWYIDCGGYAEFVEVTQASDINLKNILGNTRLSLGTMANAPLVIFDWKNKVNKKHHVGTIAQYWEDALPEVVSITKNDTLALAYGELGVAMGISLANHLTNTNDEVSKLKKRVEELENENKRLQERVDALVA